MNGKGQMDSSRTREPQTGKVTTPPPVTRSFFNVFFSMKIDNAFKTKYYQKWNARKAKGPMGTWGR